MSQSPTIALNDGRAMPQLGLGVWQTPDQDVAALVGGALDGGYRLIDTAAIYGNERGVGAGLRASRVAREQIFLTTKLWNDRQGADKAPVAFQRSLDRLGLDYVDLYLIHWPAPAQDLFVESWKVLIRLREEGRARSIGVSNFRAADLRRIFDETGVAPALNQIELHPRFQQAELRAVHAELGIATESWSPLGQGQLLADPVIAALAAKHGKSPAQVILRWHVELGLFVIPKSVTPARIAQNIDVFDFALDSQDMAAIARLDDPEGRIGPDPSKVG